ncbi:MAG: MerR family transcriptional regulator [Firmicutes bacterium]|nr:MerR family transcriptional regulator [Bacillota bacterium]
MNGYLTIQEFSKICGIEVSTLRYWDDLSLFSPIMRDPENNYRYYSLAQILALNFVTTLSDLEIPLKTISELRHERDPENFLRLLEKQEKVLDMELRRLRERSSIIHTRRELINYGTKVDENTISVLNRDMKEIILWPPNIYEKDDTFIEAMAHFIVKTNDLHINLSFPVGAYHANMASFLKGPTLPDRFFSIDPLGDHLRKEGKYLVGFARGYYGELGDLPERMADYAKKNELELTGPVYTMYLHDEICTNEPNDFLAQSCIAIVEHEE